MSEDFDVKRYALTRLHETFGSPEQVTHGECQWSLRRGTWAGNVNVRISGSNNGTVVWVFDPHDQSQEVSSTRIEQRAHVDTLIDQIQSRLVPDGKRPT